MADKARKVKFKPSRLLGAAAIILVVFFGADFVKRNLYNDEHHNLVIDGEFRQPIEYPTIPEPSEAEDAVNLANDKNDTKTPTVGVDNIGQYELMLSESKIAEGKLAVCDQDHPVDSGYAGDVVNLLSVKNEYYSLYSESILLEEGAAEALNEMMADYNNDTGLSDFVVYGTDNTYTGEESCCPEYFSESQLGTTVDLALKAYGEVIEYDGLDDESWVIENCWKYGFIVRYPKGKDDATGHSYCPWHLRYVGGVHASIMHDNNLSLDEYTDFLRDFTPEEPLQYEYEAQLYTVFSVKSTGESTVVNVPISGAYSVSGNNKDGFIITTPKS
ncbi:MAG: M15 family metallopeptidase [Ruminococcus sp.]|nr:M15 family metallopeptidase [Ruminococcus sp.]